MTFFVGIIIRLRYSYGASILTTHAACTSGGLTFTLFRVRQCEGVRRARGSLWGFNYFFAFGGVIARVFIGSYGVFRFKGMGEVERAARVRGRVYLGQGSMFRARQRGYRHGTL